MHCKKILAVILAGMMVLSCPETSLAYSNTDLEPSESEDTSLSEESFNEPDSVASDDEGASDLTQEGESELIEGDPELSEGDPVPDNEIEPDIILEDDAISSSDEEIIAGSEEATKDPVNAGESHEEKESLEDKFYTGYIPEDNPIPITHNEAKDPSMTLFGMGEELPSKYVTAKLPPLRDQSPYGTCWAFSSMAIVETNLMKKGIMEEPDLSELHLAYFSYNTVVDPLGGTEGDYRVTEKQGLLSLGGNYSLAFSTLAQWMGAADEDTARYDRDDAVATSTGLQDAIAYDDVAHIRDYYVETVGLDEFRETGDLTMLNSVKKLIYDQGAVGTSFAALNGFIAVTDTTTYSKEHNCYYNPKPSMINHAVAIVGWDDDFPKENFSTTPPGDGAFLIRNSWTTDNNSKDSFSGYFWMSYYEATLEDRFYSADAESADNFDNNYEYDGNVLVYSYGVYECGANVFTAHAVNGVNGEELQAVSFYSSAANEDYRVEIYTDVVDTPDSGVLVDSATTSGTLAFAGVHTIPLNNSVYLEPGCKFAVVVSTSSGSLVQIVSRYDETSQSASKPGESFYRSGDRWIDCETSGNFIIKAYTCNADSPEYVAPSDISFDNVKDNTLSMNVGQVFKIVSRVLPASASDRTIIWSSSNEGVAKVKNGQIEAVGAGQAVITASSSDGLIRKEIALTVEMGLMGISLSCSTVIDFISGETYVQYRATCNPKTYVPKGKPVWSSSDEDVVTIDKDGKLKQKMMGEAVITCSLDGKSSYDTFTVKPSWDFFDYEVDDEKVVTLKWKKAKYASGYRIYRNGDFITTVEDDGSDSYSYVDEYFKDKEEEKAEYYFAPVYDEEYTLYSFNIVLGRNYNITYILNGGTQNPDNPQKYISGRSYDIQKPTPPKGYDFAGWYSDAGFKNWKSTIEVSDKGDLTFYAKYIPKAPELTVDKSSVFLSRGGSTLVTATYEPGSGNEIYEWKSYDKNIVKISAKGGAATLTAGDKIGSTVVTVTCKGLTEYINVDVQNIIEFTTGKVTITEADGDYVELGIRVADEYSAMPILWSSSDESVATVSNGMVHPVNGYDETRKVTITAKISGTDYSDTCEVTILKQSVAEIPTGSVDGRAVEDSEADTLRVKKGAVFTLSSKTNRASIFYALEGKEPSVTAGGIAADEYTHFYSEALSIDDDKTIKALAYKDGSKISGIKTYVIRVIRDDRGDITEDALWKDLFHEDSTNVPGGIWYIFKKRDGVYTKVYESSDITAGTVSTEYSDYYTGSAVTFSDSINVYHGTRKLIEGRDYTLTYRNNTLSAFATDKKAPSVTIKGKGNYAGNATFSFTIGSISINNAEITSEKGVSVMAGKTTKLSGIKPVVKFEGKTLKAGKDYSLTYHEDGPEGRVVDPAATVLSDINKTYVIAITGSGNYNGDMDQSVTVKTADPKSDVSAARLKITDAKGKAYKLKFPYDPEGISVKELFDHQGGTLQPAAFVMNGKTPLRYGIDFTVRSAEGEDTLTASGKHSIIIEGTDVPDQSGISYIGTKTQTLEIVGTPMSKVKFTGLLTATQYTGKQIGFTVDEAGRQLKSDFGTVTLSCRDSSGQTRTLIPSIDGVNGDYTVSCPIMEDPGKYTIIFTGINGFNGTIKKTVSVKAFDVKKNTGNKLKIEVGDAVFSKAGAKPSVKVLFMVGDNPDGTHNEPLTLKEGIDYSLAYKNNGKVADKNAGSAPTVIVKGIGNFTGSNATQNFSITRAPIQMAYLLASDVKYKAGGKKGYFLAAAKLYQDGKALTIGRGKDVGALSGGDLKYTYAGKTVLLNDITKYDGEEVSPDDPVPPGTVIRVSVDASKLSLLSGVSFKNEESESAAVYGYYKVFDPAKSISSYKAELMDKNKPFFNNGDVIWLKESDICLYKAVQGQKQRCDIENYKIKSITNNRFIGTATVVLQGSGDFGGTKTFTVKIGQKKFSGN